MMGATNNTPLKTRVGLFRTVSKSMSREQISAVRLHPGLGVAWGSTDGERDGSDNGEGEVYTATSLTRYARESMCNGASLNVYNLS